MGTPPDMEFFLLGLFVSVNLVLWATALLATYLGLKITKSTTWNPKLSVVSKKAVSAYHSMDQQYLNSDPDNNTSSEDIIGLNNTDNCNSNSNVNFWDY